MIFGVDPVNNSSPPMPLLAHESLVLLFRNQPELAAQLLREALHLELPAYTEGRPASSDLTEVVPAEFRADAVVLAVLSALAHGGDEPELAGKVGAAAIVAALGLDQERAALYSHLIDAALSSAARSALEALMQTQSISIKSEFARIQRASAQTEGVLLVLEGRGLAVSAAQRERILACSDLELLKIWLRRAGIVANTDALFE